MISTKCSLKVFNFRHVNKPGTLKLDKQSKKLIFKEDGIGTEFSYILDIVNIKEKEFKKGILKEHIKIFYDNEWYNFTNFTDENYRIINKELDLLLA
ncbi:MULTISPECIES: hypothetical protein [Mammaliicoccus]|uniref:hypothetical protein n=1 Tax=Mammaliicoccus TaxID=2803850 RepID=UPI00065B90B2|nr:MULTISPECIES: hypothetical protein [Mammaliicoccus]MBO1220017.1 hypothetical protein [Mammaliicoccus sciuri]MBO1232039.1 hypothetical protein [Mammaliicoccus sciuri]PNY93743.1 hypothetical protein CD035_09805 [Mammaliicoccus sciuri]WRY63403.1 hypothetical protein P8F79_00740 [Mammaliicoccus sciuri]SFV45428.1 Hypothetical protein SSCIU_02269 [Mammaliicoccus sciuri]